MSIPINKNVPLRIAVIGLGIAGQSHLLDAVTSPDLEVVAVCCLHLSKATQVASSFGISSAYDNINALLEKESVQAVVIATPPKFFADYSIECMRSGCNLLIEKPLATQQAELDKIQNALHHFNRTLVVPYTRRYNNIWRQVRQWIMNQKIGSLINIKGHWLGPYRNRYLPNAETPSSPSNSSYLSWA